MTNASLAEKQPHQNPSQQGWVGMVIISAIGFTCLMFLRDPMELAQAGVTGVFTMGIVGMWRWSWFLVQVIRSRLYLHVVFPRWRRRANEVAVEDLPHMCFMIPTYKEKMWVNELVYKAIVREAKSLARPITILVNGSSLEENAAIRQIIEEHDPGLEHINLYELTQKDGKRKAMADGLRLLRTLNLPEDTIVALMDGDSELCPGVLRGCLPFFKLFPKLGALTTDEMPVVKGSYVFSEWFHLRFCQRHYQMCSLSLSRKVLCLTGRFSLFHSRAAFHEDFINQLEHDSLDDWLWGRFKFLSGDDKSTWYSLLRWRYEMIYIPDVMVNSLETHSGSVMKRSYSNMKRWFGNMLRNSDRAINLGPRAAGLFPWWCLLDQRISMWTSLITPGLLLLSILFGKWALTGIIISWVCFSRPLMLLIIFLGRPSHLKPIHFPILVATQWASAVIKVWNQMNMAQQSWNNRGNQTIKAQTKGMIRNVQLGVAQFTVITQSLAFIVLLLWCWFGILTPFQDLESWWVKRQQPVEQLTTQIVEAVNYGIIPNDNQDDAEALQALIDNAPKTSQVQINLPLGELDLARPLQINRSHLMLRGQDAERTIFQARFNPTQENTFITVRPPSEEVNPLQDIQLRGFTLRSGAKSPTAKSHRLDGILFKQVQHAAVKEVDLVTQGRPVILDHAEDVTVEYVTVRGTMTAPISLQQPNDSLPMTEEDSVVMRDN